MPLSGRLEPWRSVWKWTALWFSCRKRFFLKTTQFATPKSKGPTTLYHYYHSLWVAANGVEILWSGLSFYTRFFLSRSLTRAVSSSLHSHGYLHLKDTVSPLYWLISHFLRQCIAHLIHSPFAVPVSFPLSLVLCYTMLLHAETWPPGLLSVWDDQNNKSELSTLRLLCLWYVGR